ncbi:MAG: mechanosensitive ion channel protein MscS [Candidatus Proteinoplasmatales archaeon SG8-5]|nr:MAG: mechanosensitive ion channel protein MscS [Candidatus Proteinoplasmatales archaeon SG8-5]
MKFKELPGRILILTIIIMLAAIVWFFNDQYPNIILFDVDINEFLFKGYQTLVAIAIVYLIFKIIFEGTFVRSVRDYRSRYAFKKAVSVLYFAGCLIVLVSIWLENTQNLLVAYGLIGAGIAIALQDFFKNFVGGILILVNKIYSVGDRIDINNRTGDVIDIGVFYTTLMEIKEWVAGDQATGRLTVIPNGFVLSGTVSNYTKDHNFIWDEISIPITYDSDWKLAQQLFMDIATKETVEIVKNAEEGISRLKDKYYSIQIRNLEPQVFITPTDNWITVDIRYVTKVYNRRDLKTLLSQHILEAVEKSDKIKIASATFDIVAFPEVRIKDTKG